MFFLIFYNVCFFFQEKLTVSLYKYNIRRGDKYKLFIVISDSDLLQSCKRIFVILLLYSEAAHQIYSPSNNRCILPSKEYSKASLLFRHALVIEDKNFRKTDSIRQKKSSCCQIAVGFQ